LKREAKHNMIDIQCDESLKNKNPNNYEEMHHYNTSSNKETKDKAPAGRGRELGEGRVSCILKVKIF